MNNKFLFTVTLNAWCGKRFGMLKKAVVEHEIFQNASIIFLQEIEEDILKFSQAEELAELLSMEVFYSPARETQLGGTHGIAILSKFPLKKKQTLSLPFFHSFYRSRTRIAQIAEIEVGNEVVVLSNVHLDVRVNIRERLEQLSPVIAEIYRHPARRVILAGDFNTTPFAWYKGGVPIFIRNQEKILTSFLRYFDFFGCAENPGYSMRPTFVPLRLDAIYVKGLKIRECRTEPDLHVSDHKPLWARIAL